MPHRKNLSIYRRDFLGGGWMHPSQAGARAIAEAAETAGHATVLVHARPDRLAEVERNLARNGLQVARRDAVGRVEVLLPSTDHDAICAALCAAAAIPGVLAATLKNAPRAPKPRA